MKDNLPYFSHDNNARRHPKMKALIAEFGFEGYGRFWALNERIAESTGAYIDISKKVNRLDLANELGLDGNGLDKFLTFLSDPEIDLINMEDGCISTDRINELFEKTIGDREYWRDRKKGKKRNQDNPTGNNNFPCGNDDFPEESHEEKDTDTDKTRLNIDKTKQDQTQTQNSEFSDSEKLFLHIWQHNPKVFNVVGRIESPKEWQNYWKTAPPTCEQVQTAMDNFIEAVKNGAIEPRYVPSMPDRFVLKGWITKSQKRFQNKTAPLSGSRSPPAVLAGRKSLGGIDDE